MFKLVVVTLLCASAFARPSEDLSFGPRLIGGAPAREGEYPFVVSIRQSPSVTFCGGALISDRWVVTAGHPVIHMTYYSLLIGVGSVHLSQQKLYNVDKIIVHPAFDQELAINDIALLRVASRIQFGPNVQPISYRTEDNLEGKIVTTMGWGSRDGVEPTLLTLKGPFINHQKCTNLFPFKVIDTQVCMGCNKGSGMYFGDPGSPLLYKGPDDTYLVGVFSWGIPNASGYPEIFTRISSFAHWIRRIAV